MSEFSDTTLVAGTLIGSRSFRVDKYGRLQASQLDVVWTPGENTARCFRALFEGPRTFMMSTTLGSLSQSMFYGNAVSGGGYPVYAEPPAQQTQPETDHRPGKLSCTCGFYAYFDDGANSYHVEGNLLGLVSGYGVLTVGTRGFRSEKARLEALVIPPKKASALTDRVRVNYPDVPVFDRKRDALEAFPMTPPPTPTPADDPDFWTRETM